MTGKDKGIIEKRYEGFVAMLEGCGASILNEDDDFVKGYIFEDFDIDVRCYLSDKVLEMFTENCMIYEDIRIKCIRLRNMAVKAFENDELRSAAAVRTSKEWRAVMELSDEIRGMLYY